MQASLMRLKKLYEVVLLSGSLVAICTPVALAATATASITVTATVLSVCSILATPMAFGNYASATLNSSATLAVACTVSTPYNVGLDAGIGTGGTVTVRRMSNGSSTLQYKMYSDPAHSVNIGQTVGTDTIPGTGNGLTQTITIYGQVLPSQLSTPGLYTDTVVATITY